MHEMRRPGNERLAVIQTPYSAVPGAPGTLERIAGATTDIQYIIHQGFTGWQSTFWVGANALLRKSALLGAEARVTDWLTASAALGATEIRDDQIDGYPVGRLNALGHFDNLDYRLRLERNVFNETPTLLTNRIRLSEMELGSGYAFSDRLQLAGNLTRTRYSDDNDSTEVELTPQVVLRLRDPLSSPITWRR